MKTIIASVFLALCTVTMAWAETSQGMDSHDAYTSGEMQTDSFINFIIIALPLILLGSLFYKKSTGFSGKKGKLYRYISFLFLMLGGLLSVFLLITALFSPILAGVLAFPD